MEKNHENQPKTMKNHENPRNKQKRYKFRHTRGVTTDLGGGQGRNKQKRYKFRHTRGVTTDLLDV